MASLPDIAKQPGVKALYRLTIHYARTKARHSVATLRHATLDDLRLEVVYARLFKHKPLTFTIERERYDALLAALLKAGFDSLSDQEGIQVYGEDTWLLERAAGAYRKSVVLAPHRVEMPYSLIVNAVDVHLPEAIREVP